MREELVYKFYIYVYSSSGSVIKTVDCGQFEFPSEEEIIEALKSNGGSYAEVHRVYTVEEMPFE